MDLYVCGFNAHGQLSREGTNHDDVRSFTKMISRSNQIKMVYAGWSLTVFDDGEHGIVISGSSNVCNSPSTVQISSRTTLKMFYESQDGELGALTIDGALASWQNGQMSSGRMGNEGVDGDVTNLAVSGSGEIFIASQSLHRNKPIQWPLRDSLRNNPEGSTSHALHVFATHEDLKTSRQPKQTFPQLRSIVQLCAFATGCTLLLEDGIVLSLGSPLHPAALGRSPDAAHPAEVPCPVDLLDGIPIRKIASSSHGWITAAVSRENDLYIWGGRPGDQQQLAALADGRGDCLVRLVDTAELDVLDVGIGAGHVLVLLNDGKVWTMGDNRYGQLGTGIDTTFERDWCEVSSAATAVGAGHIGQVGCGPYSSWLLVSTEGITSKNEHKDVSS